jgi:hypothetical protein
VLPQPNLCFSLLPHASLLLLLLLDPFPPAGRLPRPTSVSLRCCATTTQAQSPARTPLHSGSSSAA